MSMKDRLSNRRSTLGKGISSLLGEMDRGGVRDEPMPDVQPAEQTVMMLDLDEIQANPHQPRKMFDEPALDDLAASLKQDGVIQPIIVAKTPSEEKFTIIAGERRWRASQRANLKTIPAILKATNQEDLLRLALIENIQRADLSVIEEAEAYQALIRDYGLTQEQVAEQVGKDRTTVTNALRMLSLPAKIQDDVLEGRLTMGHGRAILSLETEDLMLEARDAVVEKGLSVRQTEQLCKKIKDGSTSDEGRPGATSKDAGDMHYVAESLCNYLQTRVRVTGDSSKGRVEISYFSSDDLERILKLMGHDF